MARRPVIALLLVAPFLGEVLSTATPPLDLLLPWNLALMVALYGSGALICREVAYRFGLGLAGLALLGAAYGVYEEALVDRFWFDPAYAATTGVGDYSRVWHTNLLLAVHLTAFHVAVSVCSSVLLVGWLFPDDRDRAWVGLRWLVVPAIALLVVLFVTSQDPPWPPAGPLLAAVGVGVAFVVAAFLSPRLRRRVPDVPDPPQPRAQPQPQPRPRMLGIIAFSCTGTHFVLVYAMPLTGLPWPAGIPIALLPILAGALVVRRWATTGPLGRDGLWVVTGILGFFLLLDSFVGLAGRYDLSAAAVLASAALTRLHRRVRATAVDSAREPIPGVSAADG